MKTNHYFKRSFLALFALLPLSLMAQTHSLESVTMETPWDGAALNCFDSITLTADVEVLGSADVTVDFFVDGRRINETPVTASEMSPGEFRAITTWNSPYIGNHSIYAQAYMSTGGTQRSASVNVEVFGVGSAPEIVLRFPMEITE